MLETITCGKEIPIKQATPNNIKKFNKQKNIKLTFQHRNYTYASMEVQ